jgi:hypothetical protein
MKSKSPIDQTKKLLEEAIASFPHDECYTCECFLGYLAQLELDADENLRSFFSTYKPERSLIHSCLGCDPCPPADAFANYLRAKKLIQL